jgi:hypothetical protein
MAPLAIQPIAPKPSIREPISRRETGDAMINYDIETTETSPIAPFVWGNSNVSQDKSFSPSYTISNDEYDPFDVSDDETLNDTSDHEDPAMGFKDEHLKKNDLGIIVALQARDDAEDRDLRSFQSLISSFDALNVYVPSPQPSPLRDGATARIFCHFVNCIGPMISMYERHPANPSLIFMGLPIPRSQQHIWSCEQNTTKPPLYMAC